VCLDLPWFNPWYRALKTHGSNMTLTKEVSDTDLNDRLKDMFQTREEFEAMNKAMAEDLFGDPKKVKKEE